VTSASWVVTVSAPACVKVAPLSWLIASPVMATPGCAK
jgi:hypothetical protein